MTEPTVPHPFPRFWRAMLWLICGITGAGAVALAIPAVSAAAGEVMGYFLYPVAAVASAAFLVGSSSRCRGQERWAWIILGLGVGLWALGECAWQGYVIGGLEVPYPGLADIFYILGYPLMLAGVLLLPHLRSGRYERLRLTLDATVGTVALSIVMWVTYLSRVVAWDSGTGFLENAINAFYPAGDVVLLVAVMILALRRSEYRYDPRLLAVSGALVATAAADIIYYAQVEAGTFVNGSWLDALWLGSYAAFLVAAYLNTRPRPATETTYGTTRWWQLVAPYAAVIALFGLTLTRIDGADALLNWASILVGGLIIARQGVAIKENREVVEKQRDDLVASVSHELRTPLTAVQGYAQLLAEDWEGLGEEDRHHLVSMVESQAGHLGRIVTDLIETARDRLGSVSLQTTEAPLAQVVAQAVASLPATAQQTVVVQTDPNSLVRADQARLQQILVNLLTNAFRYGKNRILVTAHRADGSVVFRVHDNGPGVPKKYESAIWERFERGAHRYDSRTPGSGIGLPIARALVEAHGGTIHQRRSEVLGGACFEFTLPAAPAGATEAARDVRAPGVPVPVTVG